MKSVFLTGASGVGKSTTYRRLVEHGLTPLPSHLTRAARADEKEGLDAHFIDTQTFAENLARGHYFETSLEQAEHAGVYYGTPRAWLDEVSAEDGPLVAIPANVLMLKGFCRILDERQRRQQALWVNLVAPYETRKARIESRITDPAVLEKRLTSGVSQGFQANADLNLDTATHSSEAVVEYILSEAQ